jgi:hypothetical protein
MRAVPVSYGTLITRPARHGSTSRVVEPTEVVLPAQAQAAAMVTVTYPLDERNCSSAVWSVTPPQSDGPALVRPEAAPYFMVLRQRNAVVYDWRTGQVTAIIRPPGTAPQGFTGVAAAGDDRTFVLAAGTGRSGFYEVALGRQGTVSQPLAQLPVPPVANVGTLFAISVNGTELALALPQAGGVATDEIMVVSLVNGATHTWPSPDPGSVYALSWANPGGLPQEAWSGHPRLLFGWTDTAPARRIARQRSGLRLLDPSSPGASLLGLHLLIPASVRAGALRTLNYPLIGSAGTVVFVTMTSHAGGNAQAAVVAFSVSTGRLLGVVMPLADEPGFGTWCGALWSDPSGGHALAACGAQGETTGTHFTREKLHFPAPNFSSGNNFFAW